MKRLMLVSLLALWPLGADAGIEAMKNLQKPEQGKVAVLSFGGEGGREFMLDGVPFQIRSGEIHPQRVPRQHWRHRIRAAKAMGLNTIAFYTFWNALERPDGSWDFSGRNDIAAFIDMCQEEGMWVLFRPGPYVCGEWDLGGLPTYLLKDDETRLRYTGNAQFMEAQTRYLEKMAEIAIPRLSKNGGPILMMQLENEYGSYKSEHDEMAYIEWLKNFWEKKGAGPFYLSEGSSPHHLRFVPKGVAVGLDPADNAWQMQTALRVAPGVPVFSSETYPGWLRHWGEGNWTPSRNALNSVRWYMKDGVSFNLFVLHGGTSFGLTAGANTNPDGTNFQPDLTSYDYGAPIGENGNLTREYFEYRDIIKAALPDAAKLPDPVQPVAMEVPAFTPRKVCAFHELQAPHRKGKYEHPMTLESLGQNQGIAIYNTKLPAGPAATLHCTPQDFALVYVDDQFIGTMDRRLNQRSIDLPERRKDAVLKVVVDTFGHVNFSKFMEKDRKGLIGKVSLGDKPLTGWRVSTIDLEKFHPRRAARARGTEKGAYYRADVELQNPSDTFLDMKDWQKGYVWVNGHLLGRYWNEGPQERLYCPGELLKNGSNVIEILDMHMTTDTPPAISGKKERNMEVRKYTKSLNNQW
ncbi:MAG: beta-galactosidase [Akkermansiaceae bacterium]|nr:beta-galactosidase [Akkermansiaceae bacterium]